MIVTARLLFPLVAIAILAGCTGQTRRLSPDEFSELEVGTGLTSQDFRSVCQRMARSLISIPQIQNADPAPKIAMVPIQNNSDVYINAEAFLSKMRKELIKHSGGKIIFLDRALTMTSQLENEIREKARGKRTTGGEETLHGADFFLTGEVDSIMKATVDGSTVYMRLSFRLTDPASAIWWEDDYEIKKHTTMGTFEK